MTTERMNEVQKDVLNGTPDPAYTPSEKAFYESVAKELAEAKAAGQKIYLAFDE